MLSKAAQMTPRYWVSTLLISSAIYSYLGLWIHDYVTALPVPDFSFDRVGDSILVLQFYRFAAYVLLAIIPAILIVKLGIPRPILFSLLAGFPLLLYWAHEICAFSITNPELKTVLFSFDVIGLVIMDAVLFIVMLPLVVIAVQSNGFLKRT